MTRPHANLRFMYLCDTEATVWGKWLWGCAWRPEPRGDCKGPQGFRLSIIPAVKPTGKPESCTWLAQEGNPSHSHERRNNSFKTRCFTAIASSFPCNKEEMQAPLLMFYFCGPDLFASDFHQFL